MIIAMFKPKLTNAAEICAASHGHRGVDIDGNHIGARGRFPCQSYARAHLPCSVYIIDDGSSGGPGVVP